MPSQSNRAVINECHSLKTRNGGLPGNAAGIFKRYTKSLIVYLPGIVFAEENISIAVQKIP